MGEMANEMARIRLKPGAQYNGGVETVSSCCKLKANIRNRAAKSPANIRPISRVAYPSARRNQRPEIAKAQENQCSAPRLNWHIKRQ